MATALSLCPKCSARLPPALGGGRVLCPNCGAEAMTTQPKTPVPARPPVALPASPRPEPAPVELKPRSLGLLIGLGAAAFVLLAGVAIVVVAALGSDKNKKDDVAQDSPRPTAKVGGDESSRRDDEATEPEKKDTKKTKKPSPRPSADPPPLANSLSEEEQKEVAAAVERGVAYLQKHAPAGPMGNHRMSGLHPLVGLTLLECGVPPTDPGLKNLTRLIRTGAPDLSETYSISLTLLFLDRLADKADKPLIALLAARLMAGQNDAGGWTYTCPPLSAKDSEKLLGYLATNPLDINRVNEPALPLLIRPDEPSGSGIAPDGPARPAKPLQRADLPGNVQNIAIVKLDAAKTKLSKSGADDNSNTQFAILGVWAARRHGVPVERSLRLISERFHQSQNGDGSWGYNLNNSVRRDSMTCAGLLGLAVARASEIPTESADKDPAIAKGLQFLGQKLQKPGGLKRPRRGGALGIGADSLGDLYWLWSVERVGVIYNLPTIGGKDWYGWGAGVIVSHQQDDGGWEGGQGPMVDTCFALLFLKRVNVAKDLTFQLQRIGPIRDPGLMRDDK